MRETTIIQVEATVLDPGASVAVTVGGVKLQRAADFTGGRWPVAMRNALHRALERRYPGLKKVKVMAGDNSKAWEAVLREYDRQVSEILKRDAEKREVEAT